MAYHGQQRSSFGGSNENERALVLDDVTATDLRKLADRLLEATRVEYVDDGVLLIMDPLPPRIARS